MIQVKGVSKQYGEQVLFEDLNFSLGFRERLGVVGRNGHGKTTLIKLIAGVESLDEGTVLVPKDYKIGYLRQTFKCTQPTVLSEACQALPEGEAEGQWRAEKILLGLGFLSSDFQRSPDEFSGGYQMRINLAKVLIAEPNLLLLDEPTNFLDIISIRWLIGFLKKWTGEIMLISHNREFMDSIVNEVIGIHRGKINKVKGKTGAYYQKILMDEEAHERTRLNLEKKKEKAQEYIDKYRAKARRASQVQSKITAMKKLGTLEKLHKVKDLNFKFNQAPIPPKYALEMRNLNFSYDAKKPYLINNFSLTVMNRDRIGIIGKNGKGKSTLMNLVAGKLNPISGSIKQHPQCEPVHFLQANTVDLAPEATVLDEVYASRIDGDRGQARRTCGIMMFSGNAALKTISVLSGGEKCRVLLAKLIGTPANTLFLDEPTHHLDMQSTQAMIDAVNAFEGATLIITHDEHFLRSVATRLVVFQSDKIFVYEGSYDAFLNDVGWEEEGGAPKETLKEDKVSKKEKRRLKAQLAQKKKEILEPIQKKIKSLEKEIEEKENLLSDKNHLIIRASGNKENQKVKTLSVEVGQLKKEIASLYEDFNETVDTHAELMKKVELENL